MGKSHSVREPRSLTAIGALLGTGLTVAVAGALSAAAAGLVAGYALLMLCVCLLPSIAPLRRALRPRRRRPRSVA